MSYLKRNRIAARPSRQARIPKMAAAATWPPGKDDILDPADNRAKSARMPKNVAHRWWEK